MFVPGQMPQHPTDAVHRLKAAASIFVSQARQGALPLVTSEVKLQHEWMGHRNTSTKI